MMQRSVVHPPLSIVSGRQSCLRISNGQRTTGNQRLPAFTLTEVMISVSLVVVLIIGVAQVFQMTSRTISSGQALQTLTRDARAAETTLSNDVQSMLTYLDQPALVIWNQGHGEFLDSNNRLADLDGQPLTADVDGNGIEGEDTVVGERMSPAVYNSRNHRVDIIGFFTSNLYRRQTSADATVIEPSAETANEAFVWYGHLLTPQAAEEAENPIWIPDGYARSWILGRQAILLKPDASTGYVPGEALLDWNAGDFELLQNSRFDVVRGSIRDYRAAIFDNAGWWRQGVLFRFAANPNPATPYDAADIAQTTPIFLNNCTSIIVEYAGDFLYQIDKGDSQIAHLSPEEQAKAWGAPVGTYTSDRGTDGQIDFVYHPAQSEQAVKQIRWYGLPRDVNSDMHGGAGRQDGAIFSTDVIPLRDLWTAANDYLVNEGHQPVGDRAPFERDPSEVYSDLKMVENRITAGTTPPDGYANIDDGMQADEAYYCAWGPLDRKPMLLRITLVMHDPQGRLPEGQTFQYILRVPGS